MTELIFQELWWAPKSISICYITMFPILWNQVNVTDIVNKSSESFFYCQSSTKEFRGNFCLKQNYYMTCKNKHKWTTALENILLDCQHHIARLAWLIQEYPFLVKKVIRNKHWKFSRGRALCHITHSLI